MKISYSKLRKITTCLYQYKLHYIDGWRRKNSKAIYDFGHVCHEVVTGFLTDRLRYNPAEAFESKWNENRNNSKLEYNNSDSFEKLMDIGKAVCKEIPASLHGITAVCDIERPFMVQLGGISLNGYVDFVCKYKKKQTLFEIKTVRSFTGYEVDMSDQLTLYSMARGIPRVGIIALIKRKNDPKIDIYTATKTRDDHIDLRRKIAKAANDISHKYYPKANDKMTCQMCDFLPICFGTKSEVRAKLKQIDTRHHTKSVQQKRRRRMTFW